MSIPSGPRRRSKAWPGGMTAGHLITERRLALGLTQRELADLAGTGVSSVRRLEAGQNTVTLAVLLAILTALGLGVAVGPRPDLRALSDAVMLEPEPADALAMPPA
jgi:transcriptional regulator with XRE-family HTH domain